ncbi:hypothetical protein L1887_10837 [Cichorium endivia]|nr:hypothetical protein L1887_10837 [Cichorium endivia]
MESGESKKRKIKSIDPEAKSKASYVDLSSSRKSTLKAQNVVEVSSSKPVKVKKGKILSSSKANSSDDDFVDKFTHFGDVEVIETYKDNVDDDDSQTDGNVVRQNDVILDKGKKVVEDISGKDVREKDDVSEEVVKSVDHNSDFDVILDGSRSLEAFKETLNSVFKKYFESKSSIDEWIRCVWDQFPGNQEILEYATKRNGEFNKVHENIVLVDDEDFNDVTPKKDNDLNEEGTSGKDI